MDSQVRIPFPLPLWTPGQTHLNYSLQKKQIRESTKNQDLSLNLLVCRAREAKLTVNKQALMRLKLSLLKLT